MRNYDRDSRRLSARKLQLTIAAAAGSPCCLIRFAPVDRVHLMAYDANGRHSTYQLAEADVDRLIARGVPAEKICLGVPFYGRASTSVARTELLADRKQFAPEPDVDEIDGRILQRAGHNRAQVKLARRQKAGRRHGLGTWPGRAPTTHRCYEPSLVPPNKMVGWRSFDR